MIASMSATAPGGRILPAAIPNGPSTCAFFKSIESPRQSGPPPEAPPGWRQLSNPVAASSATALRRLVSREPAYAVSGGVPAVVPPARTTGPV